jgi:predicted GIY-YIG superfamily endonuclease
MYSPPRFYYVYIMTNRSKTLYTGVTGYLERRVLEHKQGIKGDFAGALFEASRHTLQNE